MSVPRTAMLLAAGLGLRMRPLTEATAKPLLQLDGRPLLDHAIDRLEAAGVETVVVNAHWQADRVADHLRSQSRRIRIIVRHEAELLDTGGAVAAALADGLLPAEPFLVVNGDNYWLDGPEPAPARLAAAYAQGAPDGVLLVHRTFQVQAETGPGDFAVDPLGIPRRREPGRVVPYIYAGLQILSPAAFCDAPSGAFSMNRIWDRLIEAGRLRAVVHDGLWFHLSRPADLAEAEGALLAQRTGETR